MLKFRLTSRQSGLAPAHVAGLMAQFRKGDKEAAGQLVEILYSELRKLAAAKMKAERGQHTWQPTLLVHELYLVLVKIKSLGGNGTGDDQDKAAFLGLAGNIMKRLLIDHSRPLYRRVERVPFDEGTEQAGSGVDSLQEVEQALSRLGELDPNFRAVVEMRVFEGLTGDEIAKHLGLSPRTIATYWNFAKRWLQKELGGRTPA